MPQIIKHNGRYTIPSFSKLWKPIQQMLADIPKLTSQGNRPLQMDFEHHLKALVYYHLQGNTSAQELIQELQENDFAREYIAPQAVLRKAALLKQPIREVLNSSCLFLNNFTAKPTRLFLTYILSLENLSPLTVLSLMASYQ